MHSDDEITFPGITLSNCIASNNGGDGLKSEGVPVRIVGSFHAENNGGDGINVEGSLTGDGIVRASGNAGSGVVVHETKQRRYSAQTGWTKQRDGKLPGS